MNEIYNPHKKMFVLFLLSMFGVVVYWQLSLWSVAKAVDRSERLVPTEGVGEIHGRIMNSIGNPLSGIRVNLILASSQATVASLDSDANGNFAFTTLTFDTYTVCTAVSNDPTSAQFYHICYDNRPPDQPATPIFLNEAMPIQQNIDIQLSNGGYISGRVTNESGQGLERDVVMVYSRSADLSFWVPYNSTSTDANGDYTIRIYGVGTYRMCAEGSRPYAGQCYNHANSVDSAQDITVNLQHLTSYDFQLPVGGSITGSVTDKNGQPVQGMEMLTYLGTPSNGSMVWSLVGNSYYSQADGHYTVTGLNAGTYRLEARNRDPDRFPYVGEFYKDAYTLDTATDILVNVEATVSNINFQVGKSGTIRGHVSDTSGAPVGQMYVRAEPVQSDTTDYLVGVTDANGDYAITFMSGGTFRIWFYEVDSVLLPAARGYASEYYNDSITAEGATPILVEPDAEINGIDAVLGHRGGISGAVIDGEGKPIPQISVGVFSHRNSSDWGQLQTVTTDDAGQFAFASLDSGNYRVCVASQGTPLVYNPICYTNSDNVNAATDIMVLPDMSTPIALTLDRLGGIAGTLTSPYHVPLKNFLVNLWRRQGSFGVFQVGSTTTDANGQYKFEGLLPSTQDQQYYLGSYGGVSEGVSYSSGYYENKVALDSATPITVLLKETIVVNLQLNFAPGVNAPPYARNEAIWLTQVATGTQFTSGSISILANDQDFENAPLQVTIATQPTHGTVELSASGTFTYTHDSSKTVFDSFTYHVSDGNSDSNDATVSIILPSATNLFLPLLER